VCVIYPQPKLGLVSGSQSGSRNGNRITCRFSRMKRVNDQQIYDISSGVKYYVLMATGPISSGHFCLSRECDLLLLLHVHLHFVLSFSCSFSVSIGM